MNITVVITYGAFFFGLVIEQMRWHGANSEEADFYLFIWSVLLPSIGFPASLISGFGINYSNKKTLFGTAFLQVLLLVALCVAATFPRTPLWVQIVTFCAMIIWRMNGFSLFNSSFPGLLPGLQCGKAMGLVWSLAGVVSLFVVPFVTKAVTSDLGWFLWIHIIFCGVGALSAILLSVLFLVDVDGSGSVMKCVAVVLDSDVSDVGGIRSDTDGSTFL